MRSGAPFPFASYRAGQREALEAARSAFASGVRTVVIEAPTGAGKSAMGMTLAREARDAYLLTAQKVLQDQYARDFRDLAVLKGRATYDCAMGAADASVAPCIAGRTFFACEACAYLRARDDALAAPLALMNYHAFLHQVHDGGAFDRRELLVLDEAHTAEAMLMSYLEVDVADAALERHGVDARLPGFLDVDYAFEVAEDLLPVLSRQAGVLEGRLAAAGAPGGRDLADLQSLRWLRSQTRRLRWLLDATADGAEWTVQAERDERGARIVWKPVDVAPLAGELLLDLGERVLMLSATVLDAPTFLRGLGIDPEDAQVIRVPSSFPPERRPLVLRPSARLTRHALERELPKLAAAVAGIVQDHDAEKGIVHTHSYRIAEAIVRALPPSERARVVTHRDADGRAAALDEHLRSARPTVLVTPSMTEGLDLADDLARFQVICKLPYPFLGDPQVAARRARDPGWYEWRTCLTLVQAYGRAVRSERDHAVTYLLDADAPGFVERQRGRLPAWFLEAVRES